jgi:hypothetical protein
VVGSTIEVEWTVKGDQSLCKYRQDERGIWAQTKTDWPEGIWHWERAIRGAMSRFAPSNHYEDYLGTHIGPRVTGSKAHDIIKGDIVFLAQGSNFGDLKGESRHIEGWVDYSIDKPGSEPNIFRQGFTVVENQPHLAVPI